jgi:hypothetical protein
MVSKAAKRGLKKKKSTKKTLEKKTTRIKPAKGYVILMGKTKTIKIKGITVFRSKTKTGSKIYKTKLLAQKSLNNFRDNASIAAQLKLAAAKPRISIFLIKNPIDIQRFKRAREFIRI